MKKIIPVLLAGLMLLSLTGCLSTGETENDPENLAKVPFTYVGESGPFAVSCEVRQLTEEDLALVAEKQRDLVTTDGYRTVFRIAYSGEAPLSALTFTFGANTQWESGSELTVRDGMEEQFTSTLDGVTELGGKIYSADGSIGGSIPPASQEFGFTIRAVTKAGDVLDESFTVAAQA